MTKTRKENERKNRERVELGRVVCLTMLIILTLLSMLCLLIVKVLYDYHQAVGCANIK